MINLLYILLYAINPCDMNYGIWLHTEIQKLLWKPCDKIVTFKLSLGCRNNLNDCYSYHCDHLKFEFSNTCNVWWK